MAAAGAESVVPDTKEVDCKICRITFKQWEDYHRHKMTSDNHISCDICSSDFYTDEGLKRHRTFMHPKEQDLSCLGCGKKYIRLGSLIAHLELDSCHAINSQARQDLAARRRQRQQLHDRFKAALKHIDENVGLRTGVKELDHNIPIDSTNPMAITFQNSDLKSSPTTTFYENKGITRYEFGGWETTHLAETEESEQLIDAIPYDEPKSAMELNPGEDLISFSEIARGMNQPWSTFSRKPAKQTLEPAEEVKYEYAENAVPRAIAPSMKKTSFPSLPGPSSFRDAGLKAPNLMDAPLEDSKFSSIWDTKRITTTAQKSIPPPSTKTLPVTDGAVTAGGLPPSHTRPLITPLPEKEYAPHDPKNPAFRAQKYWVSFTKKFRCPHRFCKKSTDTASGFIQHLLSAAHARDNRLSCPNCYRSFGTYTALTQHCESQGLRCNIREADNFAEIIDDITSSVADVRGRHDDSTVKYAVNQDGWGELGEIQSMEKRYREAEENNSLNRANYWKTHDQDFEW